MLDDLERKMLEDILANTEKALEENCYGNVKEHSEKALNFAALTLNNLMMLIDDEFEPTLLEPPVSEYLHRTRHYVSDELNAVALLAIRALCSEQLLENRIVCTLRFNEVFEVLNRVDQRNDDTIGYI